MATLQISVGIYQERGGAVEGIIDKTLLIIGKIT
jgi:hypothetical protein